MAVSQGSMNKAFVSAIDFLDQREIDPKIYDVARDRALTDVMKLVNRYKPSTMYNYHNFINQNVWETATVSSVTTTGLAQIQFAVTTGSGYPRVGDLIKSSNPNNVGKQARIQAVSLVSGVATLTVRTPNNVPFFATTTDIIGFQSNAYSERSDSPTNRRYGLTKYFNLIQIFREDDDITDVQKATFIEVEVNGDYHILPYQTVQKLTYLNGIISAQMIAGVQSVTQFGDQNPFLTDTGTGYPVQTTGGLDWYVTTYGISDQVATLGTLVLTDLDEIIDNWIAAKAPLDQMAFSGIKPKRAFDKLVKNLGSSGITSVRLILDGNEANFNVDHLSYSGAEMDFVYLPIIDHPQLFGPTLTPDINGSFYWVPKDQIQTVGGGMEPRMQIRHTTTNPFMGGGANMSSNGIISEWRTGALAGNPTNSTANLHTDWYTAQGLECIGVQHFQKYRVI